jgi:hypothetical protein
MPISEKSAYVDRFLRNRWVESSVEQHERSLARSFVCDAAKQIDASPSKRDADFGEIGLLGAQTVEFARCKLELDVCQMPIKPSLDPLRFAL